MSTAMRFRLAEYDRMIEQGVFENSRHRPVELIHGEIREMSPPGPAHEEVVDLLAAWSFGGTDRQEVRVRVQNSIGIPELDSAPLPDIAWVRERSYRGGRPLPADVLLIIEVADTNLAYDRGEKAEIYAGAGINEYWIVNLQDWCVEVYRVPYGKGYRERRTFELGETMRPVAVANIELEVSSLFSMAQ